MKNNILHFILLLFAGLPVIAAGQQPERRAARHPINYDERWIKHQIVTLCSHNMEGRGYVHRGVEKAAQYIKEQFTEIGLSTYPIDSESYYQTYSFPVNTFPDKMELHINKKELVPGADYIIDAASPSYYTEKKKQIKRINLSDITDSTEWGAEKASWHTDEHVYYLEHTDSLCKRLHIRESQLAGNLPKGCFIIPQHGKLIWTVATDTIPATVFYVEDTILHGRPRKAEVAVHAKFIPSYKNKNIIGCIPGEVKDSFIVFTAHYDHLGMMGAHAVFPGASDNASGTAMMLFLAKRFVKTFPHYTMIFIAFSGEEAGLLGSKYFVEHPTFDLSHIRFLTNIDIMGDATGGITVVNATEFPKEFDLLQSINAKKNYLSAVKSRGKAAISDHYFFTEAAVPSFFIYSNGGKGYYHDVFDVAKAVTLDNIDGVANLLTDFADDLK